MNTFDVFAAHGTRVTDRILVSQRPEFPDVNAVRHGAAALAPEPMVLEGIVYSLLETVLVELEEDRRRVLRATPQFEECGDPRYACSLDDVVPMEFHLRTHRTDDGRATFVPERDIIVGSRVCHGGIGSYAMSDLIVWGQATAANMGVQPLRVTAADLAMATRNGLYDRSGFRFEQGTGEHDRPGRDGHYCIDTLGDLTPRASSRTTARPLDEFVRWLRDEIARHARPDDLRRRYLAALTVRAADRHTRRDDP